MKEIGKVVLILLLGYSLLVGVVAASAGDVDIRAEIEAGNVALVKAWLETSSDANAQVDGWPLIVIAAIDGQREIAALLLELGADIDARNENGDTGIIMAAYMGLPDMITFLAKQGADLNAQGEDDKTALIWAAEKGYYEAVEALVAYGADVHLSVHLCRDAYYFASKKGHTKIMKLLVEHGADTDVQKCDQEISRVSAKRQRAKECLMALAFLPALTNLYAQSSADELAPLTAAEAVEEQLQAELLAIRKQANRGNPIQQFTLGLLYESGDCSLPKDFKEAAHWYKQAAENGYAEELRNFLNKLEK